MKAFATKKIRDGLMRGVPGRFEFNRLSTHFDVIILGRLLGGAIK